MSQIEDLGRHAAVCKNWRWLPGMLVWRGLRVIQGGTPISARLEDGRLTTMRGTVPDLTDPATLGCLLSLVREAWGPRVHATHRPDVGVSEAWYVSHRKGPPPWRGFTGPTEAEALVAALEAAP